MTGNSSFDTKLRETTRTTLGSYIETLHTAIKVPPYSNRFISAGILSTIFQLKP